MDTKQWWQSRTIWGGLISGACTLLTMFGVVDVTPEEQAGMLDKLLAAFAVVGEIVGFALVIYGRLKAKKPITPSRTAPPDSEAIRPQ